MTSNSWYVYVLRNANNAAKIYTGSTNDPARRLKSHQGGVRSGGAKTTARWGKDNARMCMLISGFASRRDALRFERAFKRKRVRGLAGIQGRMAALHRMSKDVRRLALWCELDAYAYFRTPQDRDKNDFLKRCASHLFNCGVDIVSHGAEEVIEI